MEFSDLWDATLDLLGELTTPRNSTATHLRLLSWRPTSCGLVDLHTFDPPIATELDERPRVGSMARRDAARGGRVISLRNHYAAVAEIDRCAPPNGRQSRSGWYH